MSTAANSDGHRKGLLIDYDFCTGCHVCEVACKKEHDLQVGQFGIKVMQYGPAEVGADAWDYFYVPVPTEFCDLCANRVAAGKLPACVHNCSARIMSYGTVEELAANATKAKMAMFVPK